MKSRKWLGVVGIVVLMGAGGVIYKWRSNIASQKPAPTPQGFAIQEDFTPISAIADCAAVESPGDDNAGPGECSPLACARAAVVSASNIKVPPHMTNEEARKHLDACLKTLTSPGKVMIIGHGIDATINTGRGFSSLNDGQRRISADNPDKWEDKLKSLPPNKISQLTLMGCSTGSGPDASGFLKTVKTDTTAVKVQAPMKNVFCGTRGLYFLGEEAFLSAPQDNNQGGRSASPPQRNFKAINPVPTVSEEQEWPFQVKNILSIKIHRYQPENEKDLLPDDIAAFVTSIQPGSAFDTSGCPLARKIGNVELYLRSDPENPMRLAVYDNGLIRNKARSDMIRYYVGSPGFLTTFQNLF
jgi:hypothetical protein